MNAATTQILVAAYADEKAAREAYAAISQLRKDGQEGIESTAVVQKDGGGKLRISESDDMSGGRGASFGALVGGAVGLLGGLPGVVVGAGLGALVAGLYARWRDTGLPDERLRALGEALDLGDAAVVAVVEPEAVEAVTAVLDSVALRVTNTAVAADMSSTIFETEEIAVLDEDPAPQPVNQGSMAAPPVQPADDLQEIEGIGPTYAARLEEAGITRFAQLAALTPTEVLAISKVRTEKAAQEWIEAAQALS